MRSHISFAATLAMLAALVLLPNSALAHGNLALSCLTVGDRACAREHLERAVQLDPARADYRQALEALKRAPWSEPVVAEPHE